MTDRESKRRYQQSAKGRAKRATYQSGPGRKARARRERERYQRVLATIREFKNRPCADCGGTFDPVCMDFDHRPGEVKRFKLGSASRLRMADVLIEIAKCDVVCANCHRLRTHRQRDHAAACMVGKRRNLADAPAVDMRLKHALTCDVPGGDGA